MVWFNRRGEDYGVVVADDVKLPPDWNPPRMGLFPPATVTPLRPDGFWFVYHGDYSGFAVFQDELEARRYAMDNEMHNCEWRRWGELR